LSVGSWVLIAATDQVLVYDRRAPGESAFTVVLNMERSQVDVDLQDSSGRIALSTHLDRNDERVEGRVILRANEGVVVGL